MEPNIKTNMNPIKTYKELWLLELLIDAILLLNIVMTFLTAKIMPN